jgi:hypothetical protein
MVVIIHNHKSKHFISHSLRGNNKEYIFKESIDKGYFVKQIKETIEE